MVRLARRSGQVARHGAARVGDQRAAPARESRSAVDRALRDHHAVVDDVDGRAVLARTARVFSRASQSRNRGSACTDASCVSCSSMMPRPLQLVDLAGQVGEAPPPRRRSSSPADRCSSRCRACPRAVSAASRLRQKAPYGERNSSGRMPVVCAISSVLASISAACLAGFWQRSWWFMRVVGDQVAVRRDLAHQIAARNVLGPLPDQPPAGHEEDRLQAAPVQLVQDHRRAAQVGAVVERQQQLARRARRAKAGERPVARRPERDRLIHGLVDDRRARHDGGRLRRRFAKCVTAAAQAGARIGAKSADSATSRRTTSMDSIDDLGTSIGGLESA